MVVAPELTNGLPKVSGDGTECPLIMRQPSLEPDGELCAGIPLPLPASARARLPLHPQVPARYYFGREVAASDRSVIKRYELPSRRYLGPTSMEAEMAFIMCNQAKVRGEMGLHHLSEHLRHRMHPMPV